MCATTTPARPALAPSYTLHEALCWMQTCLQSRTPSLPTRRCACLLLRSASSQLRRLCKEQNRTWREQLRMSRRSNKNLLLGYSLPLPTPCHVDVCCVNVLLYNSIGQPTCHCIASAINTRKCSGCWQEAVHMRSPASRNELLLGEHQLNESCLHGRLVERTMLWIKLG